MAAIFFKIAATVDYFSSYKAQFQCFVSEKIGLFVFLCIDNELNMHNKCNQCKFITKQTIISDFLLKYPRVQLLVTQKHIVLINVDAKLYMLCE